MQQRKVQFEHSNYESDSFGEKIIGIFPIFGIAKLRYSSIPAIYSTLLGDSDFDFTDSHYTVWEKSPKCQNTSPLQYQVWEEFL